MVDTGRCSSKKCTLRNSGELASNPMCCGQVAIEVIEVECEGFMYTTRKIIACGCIECSEGREIIIEGGVYLDNTDETVEHIQLNVEGLEKSTSLTVYNGRFRALDIPSHDVVTIRYVPKASEEYMGTLAKVLQLTLVICQVPARHYKYLFHLTPL